MKNNLSLSNLQLLPELSQAIEKFARKKGIKFQTAVIELLTIGLEQVDPSYSAVSPAKQSIESEQEVNDLEEILSKLTTRLIGKSNLNINPETIKSLTLEILKSQLEPQKITQSTTKEPQTSILPSSYLQISDFFTTTEQKKLIQYCLNHEQEFVATTTSVNTNNYRKSQVLYSFPEFKNLISNKIEFILPDVLAQLEIPNFEIAEIEAQITAHNDGHFYKIHNDNGSKDTASRVLTYVYYFYQEPKVFSGGELKIYDSKVENNYYVAADSYNIVEPKNNSIIFFLSHYMHEVLPIKCTSQNFVDSRFTINGWIRK